MNQAEPFDLSALAITLDECEAALAPYRRRYTEDGAKGMVAHITILYPFCRSDDWGPEAEQTLAATVARVKPFDLSFTRLGRFTNPPALYLTPSPADVIIFLIRSTSEAFPGLLPYGGSIALDRLIPHATIAVSPPADDLDVVENQFMESALPLLPKKFLVRDLWLITKSNEKWRKHTSFRLDGS